MLQCICGETWNLIYPLFSRQEQFLCIIVTGICSCLKACDHRKGVLKYTTVESQSWSPSWWWDSPHLATQYMSDPHGLWPSDALNCSISAIVGQFYGFPPALTWIIGGTYSQSHMTLNILPVRPPSLPFQEVLLFVPFMCLGCVVKTSLWQKQLFPVFQELSLRDSEESVGVFMPWCSPGEKSLPSREGLWITSLCAPLLVFEEFCFSSVFTSLLSFLLPFSSPASPPKSLLHRIWRFRRTGLSEQWPW